jgi:tetratricopeptide (TPR) repeat protein
VILTLALAPAAPARAQFQTPPADNGLTGIVQSAEGLEEGLGADQRPTLARVNKLLAEGKFAEADRLVDEVLAYFAKQSADGRRDYVSVANRDQLQRYRKEHPGDRELVWLDWGYGFALLKKGWIASSRARWKEAEEWLDKSIKARPYSAEAHNERGYMLNRHGRYSDAATAFRTALTLAQTYRLEKAFEPLSLRGLSYAMIEMKDLSGARKALRDSLKIDPGNRLAQNELIHVRQQEEKQIDAALAGLDKQKRWVDAVAKLDKIVEADPANAAARLRRAAALAELGKWDGAVENLEALLTFDDSDPWAWYCLAVARLGAGQDADYRRTCARMLRRYPKADAETAFFVIRACRVAPDAVEETDDLLALAEAEYKDQPNSVASRSNLGCMLYRAGRFDDAIPRLDDALKAQKSGEFTTFYDLTFLAMAHQRLGRSEVARNHLADAMKVLDAATAPGREPLPWFARVAAERLRQEAAALVNPSARAAKP